MKFHSIIFGLLLSLVAFAQYLPIGFRPNGTIGLPLSVDSQMPTGVAQYSSPQTSPWTWSFTNNAGTVLYMYFVFGINGVIPTATYNGVTMALIGQQDVSNNNSGVFHLFRLISPATGAHNVVITWTGGTSTVLAAAISFTGNAATPDNSNPSVNGWNLTRPTYTSTGITTAVFTNATAGTSTGNIVIQAACYGDITASVTQTGTLSATSNTDSSGFCANIELQYQNATSGTTVTTFTNSLATSYASISIAVLGAANPVNPIRPLSLLPDNCANTQNGVAGTTSACTWNTPPPAGSSLVCSGSTWNTGTGTVSGVSISDGTAFTTAISFQYVVPNKWLIIAYRFNIGVTAPATVTMTLAGGGTDANADIVCNAFRDNIGTPTPDGTCQATGTSTAGSAFPCGTAITTTGSDYVYNHLAVTASFPIPNSSGAWELGTFIKGSISTHTIQSSAGSITPNGGVPISGAQNIGTLGFAIKP